MFLVSWVSTLQNMNVKILHSIVWTLVEVGKSVCFILYYGTESRQSGFMEATQVVGNRFLFVGCIHMSGVRRVHTMRVE